MAIPAGDEYEWKDSLFWEVIRKCNPRATRSLLKIKGYKRAVLVKHLNLESWISLKSILKTLMLDLLCIWNKPKLKLK